MLGHGNEAVGRHEAAVLPWPAQQGLQADQGMGFQVHLGLVDQEELGAVDGRAQVGQQQGAVACLHAHVRGVLQQLAPVVALGALEGDGGVLDQVGAGLAFTGQVHVAAGQRDLVRHAVHGQGLARAVQQLAQGHFPCGAQDAEGVRAHARQQHAGGQGAGQAAGHGFEQAVAEAVAHHVVGGAEVVDVHQGQHMVLRAAPHAFVHFFHEVGAVGQADQGVEIGGLVQALQQAAVVQQRAQVGAEDFEQLAVQCAVRGRRVDEDGHVLLVATAYVQGHAALHAIDVAAGLQRLAQQAQPA
ncbi:MAG: hypothetical protein GAK34_02557 [Delftia tsuruhatensis]|nr:MAG: hypothetical protein GAK34_02557 [Delftia tsuruhatensis]